MSHIKQRRLLLSKCAEDLSKQMQGEMTEQCNSMRAYSEVCVKLQPEELYLKVKAE